MTPKPIFYAVDASRVSLREFWFETKLFIWVALIIKLFRLRPRGSTDDLAVDSILSFQSDPARIAIDAVARLEPMINTLRHLGFGEPIWFDQDDPFQATHNTFAVLLHSSGRAWARIQRRVNHGRVPAKVKLFTTFVSQTSSGFVVTGNGRHDMAWPDTHDTVRFKHRPVEQVWTSHQERLTAGVQIIAAVGLAQAAERYHVSLRDFHLARGVFQPLGDEEYLLYAPAPAPAGSSPPVAPLPPLNSAASASVGSSPGADPAAFPAHTSEQASSSPAGLQSIPPDLMETAALAELIKLQKKQVNWRFAALLLAVSAGLFVFSARSGESGSDWEFIGIIVGVLLFHEMGHYLAMKMFGYKNLKMFFIPGFGAAVSGRHYNAPAWKKIIVSLMGPLPGIAVGVVMLAAAAWYQNDLLHRIGLLSVILNAFNLIPVLPLDGGWVAHAALFARHPKLDFGFRLVAAMLMIAGGMLIPGMRVLLFVGIFSLLALPMAFKLAQLVKELRTVPGLGVSPDSQTIPTDTARTILARVRERFRSHLSPKLAAQHVAGVFESLNARPPSIGATLGLLTVHGTAFGVAAIAVVAAIVWNHRNETFASNAPEYDPVSAQTIMVQGAPPPATRNVVVVRFKTDAGALQAAAALPPQRPATRFGQTLLVAFARDESVEQMKLFHQYEPVADDVFVTHDKLYADVWLTFKWPDDEAAGETFEDLEAYLLCSRWKVAPPWASEADWPIARRGEAMRLRRLVLDLQMSGPSSFDSQVQREERTAAQRRGDIAEAERIDTDIRQKADVAEKARFARIEAEHGHAPLIAQWKSIHDDKNYAGRDARSKAELAPQLGPWPDGKPDDVLAVQGFAMGGMGADHTVNCSFAKVDTGLVALTRWLIDHGATDVKYRMYGMPSRGAGDADEP